MEATLVLAGGREASSFRRRLSKARNRALTLIEAAMVLGLFAFIVGAAMYYYGQSNTNRQVTNGMGELASVQQAVRSLYGGQSDFSGITNASLTATSALPKKMVSGNATAGNIRNSFGGAVTVASANLGGAGAGSGFSVRFDNVPKEACAKMAAQDLGRGLFSIATPGLTKSASNQNNPPPLTPVEAQTGCSGSANTITWTFY